MTTNLERSIKTLGTKITRMEARQGLVSRQITAANTRFREIYRVWDGFFKLFFTALLLYVEFRIWWLCRSLYYTDGKWSFGTIIFGGIITVIVSVLVIWIIWHLANLFLKRKMEMPCRDGDC